MAESSTNKRIVWAVVAALGAFALLTLGPSGSEDSAQRISASPSSSSSPAPEISGPIAPEPVAESRPPLELSLRSGQTLGDAMGALGLERGEAHAAVSELSRFVDPRRLRPGDVYRARFDSTAEISAIEVALAGRGEVRLVRADDAWRATFRPVERETRLRFVRGEVEDGFEAAIKAAGANTELAYRVAEVLQWDIDFNRDLRRGDRFEVVYEDVYLDGRPHGVGEVVALAYVNGGRRIEAFHYGSGVDRGYFDADGQPLQKMFLRSPMKYSRVTSRFTPRRFHPVLKVYRPHYGVDYGAPTGTPAYVTANGVVTFMGWDGGGGRTVKVRHPNGYVSNYLHLSRFPSSLRVGSRVRQGEVIGYVGSTGLSTAPHLDYRVTLNGRWIDPLRIANVRAEPLARADRAAFATWSAAVRQGLERGEIPAILVQGTARADSPALVAGVPALPSTSEVDTLSSAAARR